MPGEQPPEHVLLHVEQRNQDAPTLGEARGEALPLPMSAGRGGIGAGVRARVHDQSLISTKRPSIAAAAAICGETGWVRPPRPWRPSKLRFEVEPHPSPVCSMSSLMPRH